MEQEKYFFNLREAKYRTGSRNNRKTISGYWKATGRDKPVVISKNNQVVGMKKVLVFYKGKPLHGSKTIWIMHEYRLNSGLIDNVRPIIEWHILMTSFKNPNFCSFMHACRWILMTGCSVEFLWRRELPKWKARVISISLGRVHRRNQAVLLMLVVILMILVQETLLKLDVLFS